MKSFRILLERVLYFLSSALTIYIALARTDADGEITDSLLNMITGDYAFDFSILFLFVVCLLVSLGLIKNVLSLNGKNFNALKDINDTDMRIVGASILLGIGTSFS